MEKKTKQQIIGMFVIIALIIVILPLLFNKNNHEAQSVSVKAPPFPDQVASTPSSPPQQTEPQTPLFSVVSTPMQELPQAGKDILATPRETIPTAVEKPMQKVPATIHSQVPLKTTLPIKQAQTKTDLLPHELSPHTLKTMAWVVQMGSFKNKDNARRLADKLRAAGYKAFLHEASHAGHINVYIGPEESKGSAKMLSNKIAQEIHMHGMILPYNPFEL